MRSDMRWLVVFAANALFLWIVAQANHHLAALPPGLGLGPVHLFALGLPVAFVSLRLNLGYALAAALPTALAVEAGTPIPSGLLVLTTAACVCVTIAVRGNFNRHEPASAMITVLATNLAFVLALTIALPPGGDRAGALRLAVDLLLSQAFVAALCRWFFAWQLALLRIFGFDLETELRETP